jgi:hypothetical protein
MTGVPRNKSKADEPVTPARAPAVPTYDRERALRRELADLAAAWDREGWPWVAQALRSALALSTRAKEER